MIAAGAVASPAMAGSLACEFQRFEVVRRPGALQPGMLGHAAQAVLQAVDAAEIEVVVAPLQNLDGLEVVIFELVHEFLVEGLERRP